MIPKTTNSSGDKNHAVGVQRETSRDSNFFVGKYTRDGQEYSLVKFNDGKEDEYVKVKLIRSFGSINLDDGEIERDCATYLNECRNGADYFNRLMQLLPQAKDTLAKLPFRDDGIDVERLLATPEPHIQIVQPFMLQDLKERLNYFVDDPSRRTLLQLLAVGEQLKIPSVCLPKRRYYRSENDEFSGAQVGSGVGRTDQLSERIDQSSTTLIPMNSVKEGDEIDVLIVGHEGALEIEGNVNAVSHDHRISRSDELDFEDAGVSTLVKLLHEAEGESNDNFRRLMTALEQTGLAAAGFDFEFEHMAIPSEFKYQSRRFSLMRNENEDGDVWELMAHRFGREVILGKRGTVLCNAAATKMVDFLNMKVAKSVVEALVKRASDDYERAPAEFLRNEDLSEMDLNDDHNHQYLSWYAARYRRNCVSPTILRLVDLDQKNLRPGAVDKFRRISKWSAFANKTRILPDLHFQVRER